MDLSSKAGPGLGVTRHGRGLAQPGQLLLDLAHLVGDGLRVGQPAVADPAADDVADGREHGRGGAGGEQGAAVAPTARG